MKLKSFALVASLVSFFVVPLNLNAAQAETPPNIIVILIDDMGWSDLGCYGGEVPTPNIDALAKGGVRFTQFYNTARCSPTRASLITGLYPHQAGMGFLDNLVRPDSIGTQGRLRDDCVTMGEVLGDAGYFTIMTGKWHMGQQHGTPPWKRGFHRHLNSASGELYFKNQRDKKNVKLFLNGVEVVSTTLWTDEWKKMVAKSKFRQWPDFGTYTSGKIALQDHDCNVWYRNIKIKQLK